MRISDVMNRRSARVATDASMSLAAELLTLTQASDLMVVEPDGRYVGVLSEGDLLRALVPDFEGLLEAGASLEQAFQIFLESGRRYSDQPIGRLIIRKSITLAPEDELLRAATVMVTKQIRRLPVVDDGQLVGTVSRADICWGLLCEGGTRPARPPEELRPG